MSNSRAEDEFYKAQALSYWSYVGLLIPVVGIILAILSRSKISGVVGSNDDEQYDLDHTRRVAMGGLIVSIVVLVLGTIGSVWWYIDYNNAVNRLNDQLNSSLFE